MRKLLAAATALVAGIMLAACTPQVSGDVVGKDHDPAHYETDMVPVYRQNCQPRTTVGYDGRTTTSVQCNQVFSHYNPVQRYVPDRYSIQVLDEESNKKHWLSVSEGEYDSIKMGDFFTNEENRGGR